MKRYVGLVVVAAVLWSGFWAVQAWSARSELVGWFEDRRADGWTATYSDITLRGFPSRIDITVTDPVLLDPERGTGWQAPFLQILGLSYNRDHVILAFADSQQVTTPEGVTDITSDGLRASLVKDGDVVQRLNLEAEVLNVTTPDQGVALAGLLMNFHQLAGAEYSLVLAADGLATQQTGLGSGGADTLEVRADLGFDQPWTLKALSADRPQPVALDLSRANYRHEGLELDVAGRVTADNKGRMDGSLTVRAVNWQALLEQAKDSGTLPREVANLMRDALSVAAGLSGRKDTLDLPLTFRRGDVSLGMIPLGKAPRLRLP